VTTIHEFGGVSGRPWDTFLLGLPNFMVTALGSWSKWPLVSTKLAKVVLQGYIYEENIGQNWIENRNFLDLVVIIKGLSIMVLNGIHKPLQLY
jgi:hypothetical protein